MKIVITAATDHELAHIRKHFTTSAESSDTPGLQFQATGIGMLATCFSVTKLIFEQQPNLIVQAGIAGTIDEQLFTGDVVAVETDFLGDIGVFENNTFNNLFNMGLMMPDDFPFESGGLRNPWLKNFDLSGITIVSAVTVNEITTNSSRIRHLRANYRAALESMEGAALHYAGLQTNTPFIQFRSISNAVGERNKKNWNIPLAIENLTEKVVQFIEKNYAGSQSVNT